MTLAAELELALKADTQRIKQDRLTGKALFLQITTGIAALEGVDNSYVSRMLAFHQGQKSTT